MVPPLPTATSGPDIQLITLQGIADRLDRIEAHLAVLAAAWGQYQGVAEAYARGGLLGARTAIRRGRNGDRTD